MKIIVTPAELLAAQLDLLPAAKATAGATEVGDLLHIQGRGDRQLGIDKGLGNA